MPTHPAEEEEQAPTVGPRQPTTSAVNFEAVERCQRGRCCPTATPIPGPPCNPSAEAPPPTTSQHSTCRPASAAPSSPPYAAWSRRIRLSQADQPNFPRPPRHGIPCRRAAGAGRPAGRATGQEGRGKRPLSGASGGRRCRPRHEATIEQENRRRRRAAAMRRRQVHATGAPPCPEEGSGR